MDAIGLSRVELTEGVMVNRTLRLALTILFQLTSMVRL